MNDTVPRESCWYCPNGAPVEDHPLGEIWALCGTCNTKPGAVQATQRMNAARDFYIGTKVAVFEWRDWDHANLGDWNSDMKEAMP